MKKLENFKLGEDELTPITLVNLAKSSSPLVELSSAAKERILKFRKIVDQALASKETFYGINTGFGALSNVCIDSSQLEQLQLNIIRSHAAGVGDILSPDQSRALCLLRLHTFALGHSGVRLELVEHLLNCVQKNILPVIPVQGSVGASGDLAPLAHLGMMLIGEGDVLVNGMPQSAKDAFHEHGIKPLTLAAKEGLSLINGTLFMTALGSYALAQARTLIETSHVTACLSLHAIRGSLSPFDARIHNIRPHRGQKLVAQFVAQLGGVNNEIMESHKGCLKVQDAYSFRCVPQVHGAVVDVYTHVHSVMETELNSVTDNPLVFEDGDVLSGGNFHGEPIAMALDYLGIGVSEIGSIAEQRVQKLMNPAMSDLPAFLVEGSGLNSGFMVPQIVCSALASENKSLAHPASVDSIPTNIDKEDHVSMGPIACRKVLKINENVSRILAIELISACQGIEFLAPLKPQNLIGKVYDEVRKRVAPLVSDRSLSRDIELIHQWILEGGVQNILKENGLEGV